MLELKGSVLRFEFPEVHPEAKFEIEFQRTFRIPDDGKTYPLPPGFGAFPVRLVDECKERVPAEWVEHGGVMLPMYQAEAMWLRFTANRVLRQGIHAYPMAVRVAAGRVNAVSGKEWRKKLHKGDYVVAPPQPWLDGFCVEPGKIRQFVAMPLGWGLTVEQQVTGKEEFGGLQIEVYPMKGDEFEKRFPKLPERLRRPGMAFRCCATKGGMSMGSSEYKTSGGVSGQALYSSNGPVLSDSSRGLHYDCLRESEDHFIPVKADMGLGAGGMMTQKIFEDPYGKDVWVGKDVSSRTFVHLANSFAWEAITQYAPPPTPCTAESYASHGFPWFEHYLDGMPIQEGGKNLKAIKSVLALGFQKGIGIFPNNASVDVPPEKIVKVSPEHAVRNGSW